MAIFQEYYISCLKLRKIRNVIFLKKKPAAVGRRDFLDTKYIKFEKKCS